MNSHPHAAPKLVTTTETSAPAATPAACPILAAAKAKMKALKKIRKHENRRLFLSWCSCLHALGFSF